jgi:predicted nucleic acid-binding protein
VLLLDADILVDIQRGHPPAVAWFDALTVAPHVPGLVIMELIQHAQNNKAFPEIKPDRTGPKVIHILRDRPGDDQGQV